MSGHEDFDDCCGLHAALDHHEPLMRKMLKHGRQAIGAYLDPGEILQDFDLGKVVRHLERSVGSREKGLTENESPRIAHCEDNLDGGGCDGVRRVLSIKGLSAGFNSQSATEVLVDDASVRGFIGDVLQHQDEM